MIWWNNSPLPVPSAPIQYTYREIEGTNSGQTLGGTYSKKVIAKKEDVSVTWQGLSPAEAVTIAKIRNGTYGKLTYYSPAEGRFVSRTMYTESITAELTEARLDLGQLDGGFSAAVIFKQK